MGAALCSVIVRLIQVALDFLPPRTSQGLLPWGPICNGVPYLVEGVIPRNAVESFPGGVLMGFECQVVGLVFVIPLRLGHIRNGGGGLNERERNIGKVARTRNHARAADKPERRVLFFPSLLGICRGLTEAHSSHVKAPPEAARSPCTVFGSLSVLGFAPRAPSLPLEFKQPLIVAPSCRYGCL